MWHPSYGKDAEVGGMPGKAFVMVWGAEDTEAALKERYRAEADGKRRMRLQGLWLLRQGRHVGEVAAAVGVHRRTVERWIDWYRHGGGLAGVLAHRQGGVGQPSRLTAEQQEQVAAEVASGRFATAAQIGAWIAETDGVAYRPGGVYDLLGRLRCHPKVPRPLHERADLAAQATWQRGASPRRSRRPG
jgi:transposase